MPRIIEINFYTRSIDFILNVLYLQKKKKNKIEYLSITKKSKIETKIISMIPRNKESMENLSASIVEVVARGIYRVHRTRARNFYPVRDHTIFLFFFFFFSFPFSPIYEDVYCFYVYRSVHTRMPTKIIPADV